MITQFLVSFCDNNVAPLQLHLSGAITVFVGDGWVNGKARLPDAKVVGDRADGEELDNDQGDWR